MLRESCLYACVVCVCDYAYFAFVCVRAQNRKQIKSNLGCAHTSRGCFLLRARITILIYFVVVYPLKGVSSYVWSKICFRDTRKQYIENRFIKNLICGKYAQKNIFQKNSLEFMYSIVYIVSIYMHGNATFGYLFGKYIFVYFIRIYNT